MKYFRLAIVFVVVLAACQEHRMIMPVQPPEGDRVVLLEEFTGKGCTNCPKGSREIENLLAIYDSNLVVVSIHAGFFANPEFFKVGEFDLRTEEGEDIFAMLGPNIGYPAGVVDRIRFNGGYQHGQQAWADFIQQEVEKDPKVEFTVARSYDSATRSLSVTVQGVAKEQLSGEVRISVMITENGIVDAQDDQEAGGIVDDYVHKHVLRGMATPFDGAPVSNGLAVGETFEGTYEMMISEDWNDSMCDVLVFVAEVKAANDISVLQAAELHVED